jgi:hypothetical protein
MIRLLGLATTTIFVAACQAASTISLRSAVPPTVTAQLAQPSNSSGDCNSWSVVFKGGSGRVPLPIIQPGQIGGAIGYTAGGSEPVSATINECGPDDQYGIRVPTGYTADWFANIVFQGTRTFNKGNAEATIFSLGFTRHTAYYLYVYDGHNRFIESYETRMEGKNPHIELMSPFENRFVVPTDGVVNLEVVHRGE